MNIIRFLTRAFPVSVLLALVTTPPLKAILKRFDASEPKQDGYLKSFRPLALSFRETTPLPADRYNLFILPVVANDANAIDANATLVATTTPPAKETNSPSSGSISVSEPPATLPLTLGSPPVLPQPDPFDVAAIDEPSTDDLIDALEREEPRDPFGSPAYLPFVPPYSVAPANLEIRSSATYERRHRK